MGTWTEAKRPGLILEVERDRSAPRSPRLGDFPCDECREGKQPAAEGARLGLAVLDLAPKNVSQANVGFCRRPKSLLMLFENGQR